MDFLGYNFTIYINHTRYTCGGEKLNLHSFDITTHLAQTRNEVLRRKDLSDQMCSPNTQTLRNPVPHLEIVFDEIQESKIFLSFITYSTPVSFSYNTT